MSKGLPPKEDWLPSEPKKLRNLIAYLEAQCRAADAHLAALNEHLEAARAKLGTVNAQR